MPNRAAIRDYVRQQTLIESDDWADGKIDAVINQGLRRLSTRFDWPWLAATTTLVTVAGTTSYDLPTGLRKTAAITRQDKPQRLVEVSLWEILGKWGGDLPTGTPTSYYRHGSKMYLDRSPSEAATYDWLYFAAPTMLSNDTDEPQFVEEFHLMLADYAIAKAWEREEDFTKASDAMAEFTKQIEEMAAFYLDLAKDHPVIFGESRTTSIRTAPYNMPFLDGV